MTRALALLIALLLCALLLTLTSRVDEPEQVIARATTTTLGSNGPELAFNEDFGRLVDASRKPPARARTAPTHRTPANVWDRIANCESGGRWDDTRGGYEGGLHFAHDTWVRAGGRRFAEHAYQATREQQIEIAVGWLARTSWAQWPVCSRKVGAR